MWKFGTTTQPDAVQLEISIASRTTRSDLPAVAYTIRDSGHEQLLSAVKSDGAVLYSVSSGHGELLRALISKSILPTGELRRFTALWAHEEFLIGSNVATSEEHIKRFQKCTIDPQNESFNKESYRYRYRLYLDEGYRRIGGSAVRQDLCSCL